MKIIVNYYGFSGNFNVDLLSFKLIMTSFVVFTSSANTEVKVT